MTRRTRSGRFVKSGRRRFGGRKRSPSRRGAHSFSVTQTGGTALAGYGLLALPASDGGSNLRTPADAPARFMNVAANAKDVFVSKDAYWAPTRGAVLGGISLVLVGKVVKAVLGPSPSIRLGKRVRLRLWE